jgi:stage III sporulation protein AE
MVPVVGGILSEASETVLVSAGIFKNSAGVYGLLAVLALWIEPFVTIGVQYLMLKLTAALCKSIDPKGCSQLVGQVSSAMGMLVAMTASVCLMLLVSIVCFMKGMA